jgi:zeaxanthin glucosyltransferase
VPAAPPRILFVVSSEPGHLHPFIGVAQALHRGGAALATFSLVDLGPRLARAGVPLVASYVEDAGLPRAGTRTRRGAELTRQLRSAAWTRRWYELQLLGMVPALVEGIERAIDAFRPDVLCVEGLFYAGAIAATRRGLAWASVSTNLAPLTPADWACPYSEAMAALAPGRQALAERYAVDLRWCAGMVVSPWLNLAFSTAEVTPPAREGYPVHLVGPSLPATARGDEPDFPWDWLDDARPLTLVSSGSVLGFPIELLLRIAHAVSDDQQTVLAIGDAVDDPGLTSLPARARAFRYVPQRALLGRARIFVTHAGMNGFLEALATGCPMLAVPLVYEQPLQARLVERLGVGVCLDDLDASVERVREALVRAASPPMAARAREIGRRFAASDGGEGAARLLTRLANERAPVPPSTDAAVAGG